MFERLKKALRPAVNPSGSGQGLAQWAADRRLSEQRLRDGAVVVDGLLLDRPFQAGCEPSSRPYIVGDELMARADLGVQDDVNIVVMHRSLKAVLEKAAGGVYADAVTHLHTTDKPLPEELLWLSLYRDSGWSGPAPAFWMRYCVLTDDAASARKWLDADTVERLMQAPAALKPTTPFFVALTRGKVYMRLQTHAGDGGQISLHALIAMERLSARALQLFGR